MKKIILIELILLALTTTAGMAQQAGEKQGSFPMQRMMQEMKKEGQSGEVPGEPMKGMQGMMQEMMKGHQSGGGLQGMGGTGGMMGMMKMMEQCSAMMESTHHSSKETQESPK
jgi:hypothetical protein